MENIIIPWNRISEALKAPFPYPDIEWRASRKGSKGGKPWCSVLAYITNRAIMDRLDGVVGAGNWHNEFQTGPQGGTICGLTIYGVTKWDGAENTEIESVKGGLSDAMKRAGVQWGVGRYLYGLTENFAEVSTTKRQGWNYVKAKTDGKEWQQHPAFWWNPPKLPSWALPENAQAQPLPQRHTRKADLATEDPKKLSRAEIKKRMEGANRFETNLFDKMVDLEKEAFRQSWDDADTAGCASILESVESRVAKEG